MQYSSTAYCTSSCFQHLWQLTTGCHLLTRFLFICTGTEGTQPAGELARWQDGSCSSVDITHSWGGNLDPFYKELWWEGNCFSSHARLKSRLPLKPAESTWNKKGTIYCPDLHKGFPCPWAVLLPDPHTGCICVRHLGCGMYVWTQIKDSLERKVLQKKDHRSIPKLR